MVMVVAVRTGERSRGAECDLTDRHGGALESERFEVGAGDVDTERVEVDARADQTCARRRDQVAADPAAEVDHGLGPGRDEAGGPMLGDPESGGLLVAVGREVHPVRELAELVPRPDPQAGLGDRGGDVRGLRCTPEPGLGLERVVTRVDRGREQALAVVGQQPAEGVEVHPAILSGGGTVGTRLGGVLVSDLALSP